MNDPNKTIPETSSKSKALSIPKFGTLKIFLSLALGILIGVLYVQKVADYLPTAMPIFMAVFVSVFIFLILVLIFLPNIFNYLIKHYTGNDIDVESFVGSIQTKVTEVADAVADKALSNSPPVVRQNIKKDLPDIIYYLFFSRLRSTGLRFLMTVFTAIAGLLGTILLFNQNQLLNKQNEKIDNQILLEEASRRSSLVVLMSNIMDKVDNEIERQQKGLSEKEMKNKKFNLSQSLIGQIAALSYSFKPYRYMDGDTLIYYPLSPERGQLLITLVLLPLDTGTFNKIYKSATFISADLKEAQLNNAYLNGVNLQRGNLKWANLDEANLSGANLEGAYLRGAILKKAILSRTIFRGANLHEAFLNLANMNYADLNGANLDGAHLHFTNLVGVNLATANLKGANLNGANLSDAYLAGTYLTINQALISKSLYNCRGLHDSIRIAISKNKPKLFNIPN